MEEGGIVAVERGGRERRGGLLCWRRVRKWEWTFGSLSHQLTVILMSEEYIGFPPSSVVNPALPSDEGPTLCCDGKVVCARQADINPTRLSDPEQIWYSTFFQHQTLGLLCYLSHLYPPIFYDAVSNA